MSFAASLLPRHADFFPGVPQLILKHININLSYSQARQMFNGCACCGGPQRLSYELPLPCHVLPAVTECILFLATACAISGLDEQRFNLHGRTSRPKCRFVRGGTVRLGKLDSFSNCLPKPDRCTTSVRSSTGVLRRSKKRPAHVQSHAGLQVLRLFMSNKSAQLPIRCSNPKSRLTIASERMKHLGRRDILEKRGIFQLMTKETTFAVDVFPANITVHVEGSPMDSRTFCCNAASLIVTTQHAVIILWLNSNSSASLLHYLC